MKLKTLKDIKHGRKVLSEDWVWKNDLKQEAVEWAKEYGSSHICTCCGKWLDFLNITSEDLK